MNATSSGHAAIIIYNYEQCVLCTLSPYDLTIGGYTGYGYGFIENVSHGTKYVLNLIYSPRIYACWPWLGKQQQQQAN